MEVRPRLAAGCTMECEQLQAPAGLYSLLVGSLVIQLQRLCGRASAVDESVENITVALHGSGLWNSTLVVWSSDNGGPSFVGGPSCANNYPCKTICVAVSLRRK